MNGIVTIDYLVEQPADAYCDGDISGIITGSVAHDISEAHVLCPSYDEAVHYLGLRAVQTDTADHFRLAPAAGITDPYLLHFTIGDMAQGLAMQYTVSTANNTASTLITLQNADEQPGPRQHTMQLVHLLHDIFSSHITGTEPSMKISHSVLNDCETYTHRWI